MSGDASSIIAEWNAPTWAQQSAQDEDAVIHSCQMCALPDLDGGDVVVTLIQRDELNLDPAAITRTAAYVIVAGVRVSLAQAARLGRALCGVEETVASETRAPSAGALEI